jgi:endonuclease/exonuclease/phosphatase family metal-dependent hydrolase
MTRRRLSEMMTWLLGAIGVLLLLFLWMAGGIQFNKSFEGKTVSSADSKPSTSKTIRVMTWNIAYAYGEGSAGVGYAPKTKAEIEENLSRMAEWIRNTRADIVLLQEVDFDAARSHGIDQLAWLAENSDLKNQAQAVTWEANYVPYPYWPPSHHFGKIRSGGGVLTRFPIRKNRVELHDKPAANAWWYNALYLFRFSQFVDIEVRPEKIVTVVNNHLEAFETKNRVRQSEKLVTWVEELSDPPAVIGGDLNTVPREAEKMAEFPDEPRDNYADDFTLPNIAKLEGFREVIERDEYLANEAKFFTFPASEPNRRLDYLFYHRTLKLLSTRIVTTGPLSDHLPVVSELEWLD